MAGDTNGKNTPPPKPSDAPLETVTGEAFEPSGGDPAVALVATHRRAAFGHLREGQPQKAFSELLRASRTVLMTPALASAIVRVALPAGAHGAAVALLRQGIEENEGHTRAVVRRQLARLLRKMDELDQAREELAIVLAEQPNDRRARAALNALLSREERWEELDASLEREVKDCLKRGAVLRAAKAALERGRVASERLGRHAEAAARFAQAAGFYEDAGELDRALDLRLLWTRALRDSGSPPAALKEAADRALALAERSGGVARAKTLLRELIPSAPGEPLQPSTSRRTTRMELVAAAEEAASKGHSAEANALLSAAVQEEPDEATERRLEAFHVARGAWRDLAQLYRDRAARTKNPAQKADALGKLAEVLEEELKDVSGAAQAYGEIVRLTGDPKALNEQVRLLRAKEDRSGVRRAVDAAVESAQDPKARALALTARGEHELARGKLEEAKRDFQAARELDGAHLPVLAGLAEVGARQGDPAPARLLRDVLEATPRRRSGRKEHLRKLAHLAKDRLKDPELARFCWDEVAAEDPLDEEANAHVAQLAKETGDDAALTSSLRAQLQKTPRGPDARKGWRELVAVLERCGKEDEAVDELRQAVRFEPGHKEAWLLLFERLAERKEDEEAAWSLEQAATSTEDERERADTWERLGHFTRERLHAFAEAKVFENRARNIREGLAMAELPTSSGIAEGPPPEETDPERTGYATPEELAFAATTPSGRHQAVLAPPPGPVRTGARPTGQRVALGSTQGRATTPPPSLGDEPMPSGRHAAQRMPASKGPSAPTPPPPLGDAPLPSGRHAAQRLPASGASKSVSRVPTPPPSLGDAPVPSGRHRVPSLADEPRPSGKRPAAPTPSGKHAAVARPSSSSLPPASRPLPGPPVPSGEYPALRRPPTFVTEEEDDKTAGAQPAWASPRPSLKGGRAHAFSPETADDRTHVQPEEPAEPPPIDVLRGPLPPRPGEDLPTAMPVPVAPVFQKRARASEPLPPPVGDQDPGPEWDASYEDEGEDGAAQAARSETIEEMEAMGSPPVADAHADADDAHGYDDGYEASRVDERDDLPYASAEAADDYAAEDDVLEVTTGDLELSAEHRAEIDRADSAEAEDWEAPPGREEPSRRTLEIPAAAEHDDLSIPMTPMLVPPPGGEPGKARLFARVRQNPLDSDGYRELSDFFDHHQDPERASLMAEIAEAIDGDPHAAPRAPRLILSATDRAGLRHPVLREESGELLGLCGIALSRMFPAKGKEAGSRDEFRMDHGRGAAATADALVTAVRILGLRAPDLFLSEENGPPFSLVYVKEPRLLIGRLAVKKELPEAELRFFAGRALFSQNPDLLALRNLSKDQLTRGMTVLISVLRGGRSLSAEARAAREALPPKGQERMLELATQLGKELPWQMLGMGARHSVNRAGLVVAGGVGPALAALRAKKALQAEVAELVRFAASERYLQLRSRRLK